MRILVVSWYMPPQNAMGALRVGKLCKYLVRMGHDVRALTVGLDLSPVGRLPVEIPEDRIVRAPWIDINKPARPAFWFPLRARVARGDQPREASDSIEPTAGPVRRLIRALDRAYRAVTNVPDAFIGWYPFAVRAGRRMLADWRPDIVFASAPPCTGLLIGRRLARLHGVPWVAEYRDRFVEDPYSRRSWLGRLRDRTVENWWLRGVAGIVTVSEPWAEDYRARLGVPVVTVQNGFDPEEFPADYPRRASDAATLRIVYTGILYLERRDPSPLFAALGLLGEDRARVRVEFYGANEAMLRAVATRHGVLDLVGIHARVPYQDSIDLQMNADVLLLLQWNNPEERGNVPGKLFEYLGSRRPVLGIGFEDGVPARLLKERGAGIVLNDPAQIAQRLRGWLEEKRAQGAIPLLPIEARHDLSREDQYALTERFLMERGSEGLEGGRADGPARREGTDTTAGFGRRVLKGAAWSIAGRWSLRVIGLVNTAILARLLTPADFGLVAMGMIVIGLVEAVFDLGVFQALMRRADTTDDDFDTAWTLGLVQGATVSVIVAVAAPFAAAYFSEPRVASLLWILAPLAFLRTCENIGIAKFQKALDFHKTFQFEVTKRVAVSLVTIGAALWFRDYRALLVGSMLGTLAGIGISYAIHSHRPRLTLGKLREIWHVSKWIMITQLGNYFSGAADRIILGNRVDAATMGYYTVGSEIAQLPYEGVIAPTNRVLLPAFAHVKDSPKGLAKAYASALGAQTMLGLPACAGVASVAPLVVNVVLGSQWVAATPIMQLLVLRGIAACLAAAGDNLVIALDRQRQFAWWAWFNLAMFVVLAVWGFPRGGPLAIAGIILLLVAMRITFHFGYLTALGLVPPSVIVAAVWRPIAGSIVMVSALTFAPLDWLGPGVVQLVMVVALGVVVYAATVLALWRLSGSPPGIEAGLLSRMSLLRAARDS